MAEPVVRCTYTKLVPIAELKAKFHPKNPNVHPDDQLDRLAEIIRYQGIRKAAVLSNRSDLLTAGHGRIVAAERAGAKVYPVDCQDYENEEQEFADLVADNALNDWSDLNLSAINSELPNLGPDFDLDMLGIKDFVLEPADILEPQCDEDEVPETADTRVKHGDVWRLGRHRLMCGDSTNNEHVDQLLDGEIPDACITDPPYSVNYDRSQEQRGGKLEVHKHYNEAEIDPTNLLSFIGNIKCDVLVMSYPIDRHFFTLAEVLKEYGFEFRKELVWVKDTFSFWMSAKYQQKHEPILWCVRKGKPLGGDVPANQSTVFEFPRPRSHDLHPTAKPVELWELLVKYHIPDNGLVYEPFTGSGTTIISAEKTGRRCFGMEMSPGYCDVILARWEKYTGKTAERLEEGANV